MRRKIYQIVEDRRILVYEDVLNHDNRILHFSDYQAPHHSEGEYVYDDEGRVLLEKEMEDGVETSRTEYTYDVKGNINRMNLYVGNELYQQQFHTYCEGGSTSEVFLLEQYSYQEVVG